MSLAGQSQVNSQTHLVVVRTLPKQVTRDRRYQRIIAVYHRTTVAYLASVDPYVPIVPHNVFKCNLQVPLYRGTQPSG